MLAREVASNSEFTLASAANHMLTAVGALEDTLPVSTVLLVICAVGGFQSRLRKKTEVKSFILSGLKNRKEKEAAGKVAAQRPSHPRGGV